MANPVDVGSCNNSSEGQKTQKVTILDAKYYKEECWLVVNVLTVQGSKRSCTIPALNRFNGKVIGEAEAHRQMEILADLFNKSRGRNIMMVADAEQVEPYEDVI
jgi:hypothetical protein